MLSEGVLLIKPSHSSGLGLQEWANTPGHFQLAVPNYTNYGDCEEGSKKREIRQHAKKKKRMPPTADKDNF